MNTQSRILSTSDRTHAVSRRTVLGHLAGAVAFLSVVRSALAETGGRSWKTAVGLNSFESGVRKYKKTYPIWEVLDFLSRHGFDGVELVSNWPMGGYPKADETEQIRSLKRLYAGYGLQVFSIQLGADGAFAPEDEVRRRWVEEFRDRAQFAKQAGCDCIGMWPGGGLRGQTMEQAIERVGRSFREAAKIAGDLGVLTAFEIEPPFVFNTEAHLKGILAAADHPNLKTIYDPSHFDLMNGSTGRPHEMLQRVGVKNIGYCHLTDTDGTLRDGGTSKHLAVGDGHANIATSLRILREGGFQGWIMMDGWEIPDPYDAATKMKRAVDAAGA